MQGKRKRKRASEKECTERDEGEGKRQQLLLGRLLDFSIIVDDDNDPPRRASEKERARARATLLYLRHADRGRPLCACMLVSPLLSERSDEESEEKGELL